MMVNYTFWVMDVLASLIIFASTIFGKRRREDGEVKSEMAGCQETVLKGPERLKLSYCILFNILYFATLVSFVVTLRYYPTYIVYLQHIAVVCFIFIAFDGWFPAKLAYPLAITFALLWFLSAHTPYRWLINNLIIVAFVFFIADVQFKNFVVLQIFMWSAFVYDVCLLAQGNLALSPSIFSVTAQNCDTLICHLFTINDAWELPSVFTVNLGQGTKVFLGTGDILLGAFVVNFANGFFKSMKYVVAVVLSFSLALGLLNQVDDIPFPALASIVPVCSLTIIICALFSGQAKDLFSLNKRSADETLGLTLA